MTENAIQELLSNDAFVGQMADSVLGRVLEKADTINQATNLLWYDLSPVVQLLYPFKQLIPLISKLPRISGDGGNAYHWKRITGINVNNVNPGVSEGNRGGVIALQVDDQIAAYKAMGFESSVTFEARLGGKNLTPDNIGNAVQSTLRSLMIGEEKALVLSNATTPIGKVGTVTGADGTAVASGFTTGTAQSAYVVGLTGQGWLSSSVTAGIPRLITRTNADGSQDTFGGGSGIFSSAGSHTVGTNGLSIVWSWPVLIGALAYAVFWGVAGSEKLGAIVTTNSYTSVTAAAGTQTYAGIASPTSDYSTNALQPDGILAIMFNQIFGQPPSLVAATNPNLPNGVVITPSGSLLSTLASGTTLSATGQHINQIDAILQAAYEQYKLGFDRILMNVQQQADFQALMFPTTSSSAGNSMRIVLEQNGSVVVGQYVTAYKNQFMNNTLTVEVHPFVPPGTIIFWSDTIPYELPGAVNLMEAHVRQDYYEIQWPLRRRAYEYGCYVDEVFVCRFTPAFAMITNITPLGTY
jgi:hypothetical protein